jgi:hypothetical protein
MKIRTGFVSNSSSSSFVMLATVENHEKALESLNDLQRAIINAMSHCFKKHKIFGQDLIMLNYMAGEYSSLPENLFQQLAEKYPAELYDNGEASLEYDEDERYLNWETIWEAVDKYQTEVEKDKDNYWSHREHF